MQANQKPHFAIVGAGIGGLALAIGLEYRGVSYTIYEAAPEFSAVGLGISFGPNAVRAIELISPEFKKKYDGIATGNKTAGKEHIFCDLWLAEEGFGAKQSWTGVSIGSETYRKSSCHRKDLLAVMKTLVSDDAVEFGKSALEVQQLDDKVQVVFKDGTSVFADAVIGCDGIRSYMRTAVLGNQYSNHLTARYSSRYVYRAVVPMDVAKDALGELAGDGIIFVGQECYLAVVPISHGTQLNILAGRLDDQEWKYEEWTHEVTKAEMLADFRDRCDARILKLLEWAKPVRWGLHHHPDTPTYVNGNICLLGDAAHASTPHQGSGAGQCLEDALMLSHLLSLVTDSSQVKPAFKIYDSILRPRGQEIVRTSDDAGRLYTLTHQECSDSIWKVADNANGRFDWIWDHDLKEDLRKAEQDFRAATMQQSEA